MREKDILADGSVYTLARQKLALFCTLNQRDFKSRTQSIFAILSIK